MKSEHKIGLGRHKMRDGIIAALDVGSSKAACIIARVSPDGAVTVLGVGNRACLGVRAGAVTDLAETEDAIRKAVDQAEKLAAVSVEGVTLATAAGYPESQIVEMEVAVDGHEITRSDVDQAIAEARAKIDVGQKQILHSFPAAYAVDGTFINTSPVGMSASTLNVAMHVITVTDGPVKNLQRCVQRAHLDVDQVIVAPFASGLSALGASEQSVGAACIDIGGGTTDVSVFLHGSMVYAGVIPSGGKAITEEIARKLFTSFEDAERLKTLAGSALMNPAHQRDYIDAPQMADTATMNRNLQRLPRSELTLVMQGEYEKLFHKVQDRLDKAGFDRQSCPIVLCGGGALTENIIDLAQQILGPRVRLARHRGIPGLPDFAQGPQFSAVIGLLGHALNGDASKSGKKRQKNAQNLWGNLTQWFRQNF